MLDKIKKLLAKAGSTDSPSEAEALFVMAQKLMVKHRITQADLDQSDLPDIAPNEVLCFANRLEGNWEIRLAATLARPNGCDFVYGKLPKKYKNAPEFNRITFYGIPNDLELVMFFFETTRDTFRRLARSEYKRLNKEGHDLPGKNQFIRSFLVGACDGLSSKMRVMTQQHIKETNATGYEVALRNSLQKAQDFIKDNVSTRKGSQAGHAGSDAGYSSGVKAGKNHSLSVPVQGSAKSNGNLLS